jgi:hypothetical protein
MLTQPEQSQRRQGIYVLAPASQLVTRPSGLYPLAPGDWTQGKRAWRRPNVKSNLNQVQVDRKPWSGFS